MPPRSFQCHVSDRRAEPYSDQIQEYCNGNPWTRGSALPVAHTGTSLAAVCWQQNGIHLRVYYQAPDMTLREHCWDGSWYAGKQKYILVGLFIF